MLAIWDFDHPITRSPARFPWIHHPHFHRLTTIQMHIPLGKGHDDSIFIKQSIESKSNFTLGYAWSNCLLKLRPEQTPKVQSIVAKFLKQDDGLRLFFNLRMFCHRLAYQPGSQFHITPVGHTNFNFPPDMIVNERPIDDGIFQ